MPDEENFVFLGKNWKVSSFVHSNFNATYMRHLLRITLYCSFFTSWCIFYNCIVQQTTLDYNLTASLLSLLGLSSVCILFGMPDEDNFIFWEKIERCYQLCTGILMRLTRGICNGNLFGCTFLYHGASFTFLWNPYLIIWKL